jgi:hypothetical protein
VKRRKIMNPFKFAAVVAAGAAFVLSPAQLAAQAAPKPISMGIRLAGTPDRAEVAALLPDRTGAALGFKVGDVLIEAGGKPVSREVLEEYMDGKNAGDELVFKVKRGEAVIELKGQALAAPENPSAPAAKPQQ